MSNKYSENAIQQLQGLDWIRLRVENHIPNKSVEGQLHVIKEVLDNSIDECEQDMSPGDLITIYLFLDKKNNRYQIAIRDNGRGVPHGAIVRSFTQLFNSGKYDRSENAVFRGSGGLNGVGVKVSCGTSTEFKVIVARDSNISTLYVHESDLNTMKFVTDIPTSIENHGTFVIFEPSKQIFTDIDQFIESGYINLVKLSYLISMFSHKTKITIKCVYGSIAQKFWDLTGEDAYNYIDKQYGYKAITIMDGADNEAAMNYLKELWQLPETEKFQWELTGIKRDFTSDIGYDISIYLPRILRNTNATTMVNNIPIFDQGSSHITTLITAIKNKLVEFVEDDYKEYFLSIYKLPICCAIAVKYVDVNFTGLAKSKFNNPRFEQQYMKMLIEDLNNVYDNEWKILYDLIAKHIVNSYSIYYNKPLSKKSNTDTLKIIKPLYYDCNTSNRSEAELYIVEGVSASHLTECRDPETQALFMIFGKPKNVFKTGSVTMTPQQIFSKYEAYRTLSDILNIRPQQTDLSTAAFSKIILMNDADIDGGHIQALHIGGLYALNPRIITSGMVYIANPPLYEVAIPSNGRYKYKYIQDKNSLIRFFIDGLYRNAFDIFVKDDKAFTTPQKLVGEEFTDFCYIITEIGELFEHLSAKLAIPPFILEKLTHITGYLKPGHVDANQISNCLGDRCMYDPKTDLLTVIGDYKDYSFGINGICEALYEELMPYLRKLSWNTLQIYVTTKYTNTLQQTMMSITQIYEMFLKVNGQLEITRQKGLGGMSPESLQPLCINKETRVLHQITSLGDFERIKSLLGDDVSARKKILSDHGLEC